MGSPTDPDSAARPPASDPSGRFLERVAALPLGDGWDLSASRLEHPFLTSAWLQAWWASFGPGESNRGALSPLLSGWPLCFRRNGKDLCALANVHTPISGRLRPLQSAGAESPWPIEGTANRIIWPSLNHPEALALAASLDRRGWIGIVEPQRRSPLVEMYSDQVAYSRTRSRDLRQRAGRLQRKLMREHNAQFRLLEANDDPGLYRACLQLEAAGWKGREATAILSNRPTTRFYQAVGLMPASRLSVITVAGSPIAFALCLLHNQRLYLLKTAYDERYRQLSPGLVLQWAIIDRCHTIPLDAYELLGSADPWKLQLSTTVRPISRLVAHTNTPAGRTRDSLRRLRPVAKDIQKRLATLTRTTAEIRSSPAAQRWLNQLRR